MSSLRNAIQRRNHRERAQPAERAKWGLLEKRKDYKLRAADHKSKTKKLAALKSKAEHRNEDEFYFSMVNTHSTKAGVRISKRGEANNGGSGGALDVDVVRLMKTQDANYLRSMLQRTRRQRERERETDVSVNGKPGNGRIVFGEDDDEDAGKDDDIDIDGLEESTSQDEKDLKPEQKRLRKREKRHRNRLEALEKQEAKLSAALEGVEHQRARMNGTTGGTNKKSGVKFKPRQRKR